MSTTADTSLTRPITIRPAKPEDAERVFDLLKQLAMTYAPDRRAFDETFAFLVTDETTLLLVAENATGMVLGYALTTISPLLHTNGRSAQLQELVVDHDSRGTGIGTELIEAIERLCQERQVKQLTVPSRRSADFYERLGYTSTADFLKRSFE
ncbi:MAG: N-acetyltransferase [Salinibacterium sp.]|nr:MAG: N-acetyltransferase [Salinibacterium sp.]